MKTRREILKQFTQDKGCTGVFCEDCPFCIKDRCVITSSRLSHIGAMAILRMFPEKKKPLLSIGTKVRFDDGSIAKIVSTTVGPELGFDTINGYTSRSLSYLLGRTWEVVE